MAKDERAQLRAWIEGSLRFRRKLAVVMAIAAVIALAVYGWWSSMIGGFALLIVGAVYGIGLWITYGHMSDWRARIELLDRKERERIRNGSRAE
jgi:amino acid transporter